MAIAATHKAPSTPTFANLQQWCCSIKSAVKGFLIDYPPADCGQLEELAAITCPDPASFPGDLPGYQAAVTGAAKKMTVFMARSTVKCFCSVLMPPCGGSIGDNCVPLAEIQVRRSDCTIISVCNWGPRRILITWPAIRYWLSPLNLGAIIGAALERICCEPIDEAVNVTFDKGAVDAGRAAVLDATPMSEFVQGWGGETKPITFHTAILSAMGARSPDGSPLVDPIELANSAESLLVHSLLRPILDGIIPSQVTALLETLAGQTAGGDPSGGQGEIAALRASIDELQKTVEAQQAAISKLQDR
jgi:hypothetical protein